MARLKRCLNPGCPEMAAPGSARCLKHTRSARVKPYPQDYKRRVYQCGAWKILRRQKLAENPVCEHCKSYLATEVDHIVALEDDGPAFERSNLQSLCRSCHSIKTQRELVARRKGSPIA